MSIANPRVISPFGDSIDSAEITDNSIVNADINSSAAVAFSKLANLTSGQMLVGNGSNVPTAVAISGDISMTNDGTATTTNCWKLVEEITISSAVTTQDFSATLAGDTDEAYLIEGRFVNDEGSTSNYALRINTATWACDRSRIRNINTTVSGAEDTDTSICTASTGDTASFTVLIPASQTGDIRHAFTRAVHNSSTSLENYNVVHDITTPAVGTEITSIGFVASNTSSIGIGSTFRIWKVVH